MKRFICFLVFTCCFQTICFAQSNFVIQNTKESDKIPFKLIHNLIVIPVEINGIVLSFILDTGVNKTIVFNFLNTADSLQTENTETVFLRGFGTGEVIKALKSKHHISKIGDAINLDMEVYAVSHPDLNFSTRLGVPIHGVIGHDLFKDFVVEINYVSKYIRLTNPKLYKYKTCRSCETLELEFYKNKPYVYITVEINNKEIPVKLLVDSGGSDALWLFEDEGLGIQVGTIFFEDFLGHGLTGSVYGKRSKIREVSINHFKLNKVNVSFPNLESLVYVKQHTDRNGSIAGDLLKRFHVILDYTNKTMTFRKNRHFKESFSYNKSGIELEQNAIRLVRQRDYTFSPKDNFLSGEDNPSKTAIVPSTKYKLTFKPAYSIVELRKDSPADKAGLMLGDILLSINNKSTDRYTLQEVIQMFYDKHGKRLKLNIERDGIEMTFVFYLEGVFEP